MSKRDARLFLEDILDAIKKVKRYTSNLTFHEFTKNDLISDAVIRNLEVIGEAARNIPPEIRNQYGTIDWRRVTGFRNIAIHAYFSVDLEIVWTIATQRLDELESVITQILNDIETEQSQ
ncbi:MAG: DUF86 domain-containing protein [Aliifodinibius sp.]|nr:DUF86 domain-containing protein [Fodinibius sp.]NIV16430.1 DUF86 domain-containing protein [Fodinibius sp.]NIY30399.1 DUF86 domain-containing protein [Fodinibius sp.]